LDGVPDCWLGPTDRVAIIKRILRIGGALSSSDDRKIFDEVAALVTEQRNPRTYGIDLLGIHEVLEAINEEDRTVPDAVRQEVPQIAKAVELVEKTIRGGGRLVYVGAGTSGRLGVLDAAECPPTFGTDPETVQGVIAGGRKALVRAVEGAEDDKDAGAQELERLGVCSRDVVMGIAASRRTPFVLGALEKALSLGSKTIYLTCSPRAGISLPVDVAICPVVGPEVIMGSTRMKAGTAEKLVLNMITTCTMIRLGKVYENMMVDLMATSRKLKERSRRTLMIAAGVDFEEAGEALKRARGSVKRALVMLRTGADADEADRLLKEAGGFVRVAIEKHG
jgi:N-acetylmuramic acid 6-phosphate etherase